MNYALLAPFTTLRDMARQTVGWPLCYLLLQNYDNVARIHELAARHRPPAVAIASGDQDEVIPNRMLSATVPGTSFWLVPQCCHNDIVFYAQAVVEAASAEPHAVAKTP